MEVLKVKDWKNKQRRLVAVAEDLQSGKIPDIQYFYLPVGIKDISNLFSSEGYRNFVNKSREEYHKNNPPKKFGELGLDMTVPFIRSKCAPLTSIVDYLKAVQ